MLEIAYRFFVLPRFHDAFQHAYNAARDVLRDMPGLLSVELAAPRQRRGAFVLRLAWDSRAGFERFTRTWVGVWMLNGMGLAREAFAAPIETASREASAPDPAREP
ncbi:MAG: antibiotic biosynthesis monooxygenase [Thiobacillus sp.]|nr:antibiotic biosynthesis monooxygenase [Thiobacillus sp.]